MSEGWVKLYRQLSESKIWFCEPFTRGQAWVDLLLLANYEPSFYYKRGNKVEVGRGQVGRSEVELGARWKWSRTKLRKFLDGLENEQQIIQHKNTVSLIITIVNYEIYQEKEQQKDSRKTAEKHIKEYKEEKEEYITPLPPKGDEKDSPLVWKKDFNVYLDELREKYKILLEDKEWIVQQEKFNPGIDIQKSIEKSCVNYWATEAGWKKKKSSKIKEIDWKSTFANAISMNKVYKDEIISKKGTNNNNTRPVKPGIGYTWNQSTLNWEKTWS